MRIKNNLRVVRDTAGSFWHEDLFQVMPERKVRVNPDAMPDLVCWLIAVSQEWEGILRRPHNGLNAVQRAALRGQKQYARNALSAVSTIIHRMHQSVPIDQMEKAYVAWQSGLAEQVTFSEKVSNLAQQVEKLKKGG